MLKIGQDLAGLFLEPPVCQRLPLGIDRQLSRNHHKPAGDTEVSIVPRGRTDGATVGALDGGDKHGDTFIQGEENHPLTWWGKTLPDYCRYETGQGYFT